METPPAAAKPIASLTPRLLARKGGARPAMRPQSGALSSAASTMGDPDLDDLGWNDLGEGAPPPAAPQMSADIITLAPKTTSALAEAEEPPVAKAGRAAMFGKEASGARARGERTAFTLRLDQERHLKLRLASTIQGRSAQQLVTDALDSLLARMPELDSLAAQLKRH